MRILALVIALCGLILTIIPSFFVFLGDLTWQAHARLMFIGMLLWFVFAPIGMKGKKQKGIAS
jgi:hypothetical protein